MPPVIHPKHRFLASWSGGKDSCFAVMRAIRAGHIPCVLLNVMNESASISRSHGLPHELLQRQAAAIGQPLHTIPSSWEDYEKHFIDSLTRLKTDYALTAAVFGDIDLQAHRDWEEKVSAAAGLEAMLPLWHEPRTPLVREMIDSGIRTVITSCRADMGERFIGQTLTFSLAQEIEALGICPCGENGEFHTFVFDCPLFSSPVDLPPYRPVRHEDYLFAEWQVQGG